MDKQQFIAEIKTILDQSGIRKDLRDIQKTLDKNPLTIRSDLFSSFSSFADSLTTVFDELNKVSSMTSTASQTNISFNAIASLAFSTIGLVSTLIQRQEELAYAAKETALAFMDENQSIDNYAETYEQLQVSLKNAKGNTEETLTLKQSLLSLQDELNEKYGEELGYINLISDAYQNQADVIQNYSKKKAQNYLNENIDDGKNAHEAMNAEKHYNLSYFFGEGNEEGRLLKSIAEQFSDIGVTANPSDGTYTLHLYANAKDAEKTINDFMTQLQAAAKGTAFEDGLSDTISLLSSELKSAKKIIDINEVADYNFSLSKIEVDSTLSKQYHDATDAAEAFNKAKAESDHPASDEAVNKAYQALLKSKKAIEENNGMWKEYSYIVDDIFASSGMEDYKFDDTQKNTPSPPLSVTDTITSINTQLKPAFSALQSAWQDIFSSEGFTAGKLDYSALDSLKSSIEDISSQYGVEVDYSDFEAFSKVILDTSSSAEQTEDAFHNMAASLINSTDLTTSLSGETKDLAASMMEQLGITNAVEISYDNLAEYAAALALQKEIAANPDLANATYEEMNAFLNQAGASELARQYLFQLIAAEEVFDNKDLDNSSKVAKLQELANAYGQTAVAAKIAAMQQAAADSHTTFNPTDKDLENLKKEVSEQIGKVNISFQGSSAGGGAGRPAGSGTGGSMAKAGKEAADTYLEAFEKEYKELGELKSDGLITEKQYLDRLRTLYTKYFRDKKQYTKEYAKYERQYLEGTKSMYESLFSYISGLMGKRITSIKEEKDAAVDSLTSQKEAAEQAHQAKIDGIDEEIKGLEQQKNILQEEIDRITAANEERERAINLQKSQYELKRLENQRTVYQYTDEKGLVYTIDTTGIRDARNEVDNAQSEIRIANLEKEISALDNHISALEAQKEAIDSMIDSSNDYWDNLIQRTEEYYDSTLGGMEEYKSRWEELSDLSKQSEMRALLQELGYTEEDVLNMNSGAFEQFKETYLNVLSALGTGNQGISDALQNASDGFDNMAQASQRAAGILSGEAGTETDAGNAGTGSQGSGGSIVAATKSLADNGVPNINKISSALSGDESSIVNSAQKVIDIIGGQGTGGAAADKDSGNGVQGNADSGSILSALQKQSEAALNEETGIPAQEMAWRRLNVPLNEAVSYLDSLRTNLEEMNGSTYTVTLEVKHTGSNVGLFDSKAPILGQDISLNSDFNFNPPPSANNRLINFKAQSTADMLGRQMSAAALPAGSAITNPSSSTVIQVGDIQLHNVQNTETLGREIVNRFPNALLQELHRR